MGASEDMPVTREKRCRLGSLHLASAVDMEVVREHAQRRGSWSEAHWDAVRASPLEGADAGTSAWAADHCNKALGQEPSAEEENLRGALVGAAEERGLAFWGGFKVFPSL